MEFYHKITYILKFEKGVTVQEDGVKFARREFKCW